MVLEEQGSSSLYPLCLPATYGSSATRDAETGNQLISIRAEVDGEGETLPFRVRGWGLLGYPGNGTGRHGGD